jgi:hypothetical protein
MTLFFDGDFSAGTAPAPPSVSVRPPLAPIFSGWDTIHNNNNDDDNNNSGNSNINNTNSAGFVANSVRVEELLQTMRREMLQQGLQFPSEVDSDLDQDSDENHNHIDTSNNHNEVGHGAQRVQQRKDEFDEFGVRMPDAARVQRLLSHRSQDLEEDLLGRTDHPSVDWMFEPPHDVSFAGTLEQARDVAREADQYVLVNIQSHQEFASQLLNRDVWSDEAVRVVLGTDFVFWQRGHTTRQGQRFMQHYRVAEADLPLIVVVDPVTGAKLATWTVSVFILTNYT